MPVAPEGAVRNLTPGRPRGRLARRQRGEQVVAEPLDDGATVGGGISLSAVTIRAPGTPGRAPRRQSRRLGVIALVAFLASGCGSGTATSPAGVTSATPAAAATPATPAGPTPASATAYADTLRIGGVDWGYQGQEMDQYRQASNGNNPGVTAVRDRPRQPRLQRPLPLRRLLQRDPGPGRRLVRAPGRRDGHPLPAHRDHVPRRHAADRRRRGLQLRGLPAHVELAGHHRQPEKQQAVKPRTVTHRLVDKFILTSTKLFLPERALLTVPLTAQLLVGTTFTRQAFRRTPPFTLPCMARQM